MRSSKQRSRSKPNRPRSLGNVVNRVFDSSGPDGKVRGTPQQIIDKYLVLARDAQLSNDRVAAENFLQHAEHYTRMLNDAQREMTREAEARREAQEAQNNREQNRDRGGPQRGQDDNSESRDDGAGESRAEDHSPPHADGQQSQPVHNEESENRSRGRNARRRPQPSDVIDLGAEDADSGLVETPEAGTRGEPTPPEGAVPVEAPASPAPEAAEQPRKAPRRRSPRKPKDQGNSDSQLPEGKSQSSAAE